MSEQLQVNIHGPGDVRVDRVAEPTPGPRDAVVRVAACGICGSDLGYVRLGGLMGPTRSPMPIGHELSGVVESVGDEVTGIEVGTRVVVDPQGAANQIGNGGSEGAFTPRLLVRNAAGGESLIPIPGDLSFEMAALAEPLGVGMRAVNQSRAQAGERAVVFGAGPIGLAAVATLRYRGVEDVVSVDYSDTRLAVAERLGAGATLNPSRDDVPARLRELHGTSLVMGAPMTGSDVYIEASGAAPVLPQIIEGAKRGARVTVVALYREAISINFLLVMMKELELRGSIAQPDDWNDMLTMLSEVDLSPMITHRFDLSNFGEALAVAQDPEVGAKVMVACGAANA
ncbi:MAG: zinc-binding dehydrogenase [Myxococcota bacterium]|nr:zinc-binding dehydrogenase [Myxococcota bacterium]